MPDALIGNCLSQQAANCSRILVLERAASIAH